MQRFLWGPVFIKNGPYPPRGLRPAPFTPLGGFTRHDIPGLP